METPPLNDYLQAALSPPVGGRLRSFRRDRVTNKCSDSMLNIITNGYILPFISKPNLVRAPLIRSGYKALQKDQALVEASNRPKQAQHPPTSRKVQNGNTRVHQGMGVVDRPIRCLPSHPHPPKLKEVPKVLPQVTGVPVHLPSLWAGHGQVFTMIVKEVKLMPLESDFTSTWMTGLSEPSLMKKHK